MPVRTKTVPRLSVNYCVGGFNWLKLTCRALNLAGVAAPVLLKLTISNSIIDGAYSTDEGTWTQVGGSVKLVGRNAMLDVGSFIFLMEFSLTQ